jgi:AraC family transcriptional regulator
MGAEVMWGAGGVHAAGRPVVTGAPAPRTPRSDPRRTGRPQLAPWQIKIAMRMMEGVTVPDTMLADVAARLGISVTHFIKAFGNSVGVSPYHWFIERRIVRAMALMEDHALPLATIATRCGFADQSHFTKTFSRLIGMPPGRWRRGRSKMLEGRGEVVPLPSWTRATPA